MRSEAGEFPCELSVLAEVFARRGRAYAQLAEGHAASLPRGRARVGAEGQIVADQPDVTPSRFGASMTVPIARGARFGQERDHVGRNRKDRQRPGTDPPVRPSQEWRQI